MIFYLVWQQDWLAVIYFEIVFSDQQCGFSSPPSIGKKYFITILNPWFSRSFCLAWTAPAALRVQFLFWCRIFFWWAANFWHTKPSLVLVCRHLALPHIFHWCWWWFISEFFWILLDLLFLVFFNFVFLVLVTNFVFDGLVVLDEISICSMDALYWEDSKSWRYALQFLIFDVFPASISSPTLFSWVRKVEKPVWRLFFVGWGLNTCLLHFGFSVMDLETQVSLSLLCFFSLCFWLCICCKMYESCICGLWHFNKNQTEKKVDTKFFFVCVWKFCLLLLSFDHKFSFFLDKVGHHTIQKVTKQDIPSVF